MLQKSIIALSTVFALSACGGSLDLGPDTPPPENGNGENGNGENGNGNGEPGPSQVYSYMTFSDEDSVDSWAYRCYDGCNATAELSWNGDEQVLAIMPEWASNEDNLEIYSPIDEIGNLEDAGVSAWVYVTEEYFNDGNMTMQLFLTNASGATGYLPEEAPAQVGWNRLQAWELSLGDEDDEDAHNSFAWYEEGFDLRSINEIGVQFSANEKATDVGGQLWIDNVLLTRAASDEEVGPLIVDLEDLVLLDGGSLELQREEGRVFLNPDGQQEFSPKIAYMLDGPVDLAGSSFTITFSVDQAFIEDGGSVDAFVQQNFDSFQGNFDEDNNCSIANEDLVADEETVYTCSNLPGFAAAEEGDQLRVGLQVNGAAGTVSVHGLEIEGLGEPVERETVTFSFEDDDEGWYVDGSSGGSLAHNVDEQALELTPDWANADEGGNRPRAVGITEDVITGADVEFVVVLTQAQVDGGLELQAYAQQNDGEFQQAFADGNFTDLQAGENTLTWSIPDSLEDARRIALQLIGPPSAGENDSVLIKEVTITLP